MASRFDLGIQWETAVQVAVIGAAFSAVGWLVSYIITTYSDHKKQRISWQLEYINRQLEELYGPLLFLILEGRQTFQDFLGLLGRDHVFKSGEPLPQPELDAWLFWVENEFLPRNEVIKALISSKTHLIGENRMPASYLEFIKHYSSWKILHKRWQDQQVPYLWHSNINWPAKFEDDVIGKFDEIKRRHSILLGNLASLKID